MNSMGLYLDGLEARREARCWRTMALCALAVAILFCGAFLGSLSRGAVLDAEAVAMRCRPSGPALPEEDTGAMVEAQAPDEGEAAGQVFEFADGAPGE